MYVHGTRHILIGTGGRPNLEATERFWKVLETIPDNQVIPARIIKLGFLTDQLQVRESGYEIQFSAERIKEETTAHVPAQTLAAIPRLLHDLIDELPEKRKRATGAFCDAADLNRPPEEGTSPDVLRDVAANTYDGCLDFIKEVSEESQDIRATSAESTSQSPATGSSDASSAGQWKETQEAGNSSTPTQTRGSSSASEAEASTTARETSEDNPFASGKEITMEGGERISGKNPFADPSRVKDTGLHQGGG